MVQQNIYIEYPSEHCRFLRQAMSFPLGPITRAPDKNCHPGRNGNCTNKHVQVPAGLAVDDRCNFCHKEQTIMSNDPCTNGGLPKCMVLSNQSDFGQSTMLL